LSGFRRVVSRRYRMPSGEASDWDILDGGRTVAVVAVTEDDRVVMVCQFRPGPGKVLLELPGGNVDGGESVEAAAERELLEETGFKATSVTVVAQTCTRSSPDKSAANSSARAVSVAVTNRRDTADFDVLTAACSTRGPTGSSPTG
jgi:ADP-ribose pyrophosphatase